MTRERFHQYIVNTKLAPVVHNPSIPSQTKIPFKSGGQKDVKAAIAELLLERKPND